MANRSMRDKQQSHENPTQNQRNLRNPPSETPNPHGANCPGAFPEPNLRSEPRSLRFNPVTDPEPPRQPLRLCPQEAYLENNPFSPWEMTMDKQKTGYFSTSYDFLSTSYERIETLLPQLCFSCSDI
ncbi:unnamed protein product [Brassica rapa]|uniref:Uncharacterized protein n=3 Tax=Brassica TaxID=3705 RepID=A0A8D9H9Q1_BRACM|nr:unnamed protein product [Brassica napus]CAF2082998.1 unnamed protein product [Brassica napus]CAG7894019.1 unnamed protein product [Brassica rapa]